MTAGAEVEPAAGAEVELAAWVNADAPGSLRPHLQEHAFRAELISLRGRGNRVQGRCALDSAGVLR